MPEVLLNPYCSLVELRDEIRNQDTDAAVVDQFTRAINDASRFIDSRLGRDFYHHDHTVSPLRLTRLSSAIVGDIIFLPYRVLTLTEVSVDGVVIQDQVDFELLTSGRGDIYGLQKLDGNWTASEILITGDFGYTQATSADVPQGIPAEIRRACILIAAAWSGHATYEVIDIEGNKQEVASKQIPKAAFEMLGLRTGILV